MKNNSCSGPRVLVFAALLAGLISSLPGQTLISGGGNYISGSGFYLGIHSATYGLKLTYDDSAADAVTLRSNRIAAWLWENYDGTTAWPAMRVDQANNLILYNGSGEGVKLIRFPSH